MLSQQYQDPTLSITAHGASNLKDVEMFGKQDPYFRFTLDIENPKTFQKSFVHKNAGKNPVWNQSFSTPLNGEQDLFIEIMDDETTADAVIAFAAIPINQVVHAPGGNLHAIFPVYTPDGKQNGEVTLTLTAHNVPGQNLGYASHQEDAQYGVSRIVDVHLKRVKSLKNKELAADAGMAVAGGLFALGAGLLVNKLNNDHNEAEQEREDAEAEAEQEREQLEEERRRLEAEQAQFQAEQEAYRRQQEEQENQNQHRDREEHHGHGGCEWDPVGSYSAGDKVEYQGRDYICLQGHVSNPTWEPSAAHSLWRAD
ncbi:hypothetical protein BGZ96_003627 [Linnemannia gamsii]|uniref:C2 domain-containing protein n=1 Tax=Linnemannia gamsii TaxID=64522 RepID=A0ABQ7KHP2_9FUNG|nr:hypothetical protein BGZ96_003627 [Linnemannia gamsii]